MSASEREHLDHPEPEFRCIDCGARYYSARIAEMCCTVRVFRGVSDR